MAVSTLKRCSAVLFGIMMTGCGGNDGPVKYEVTGTVSYLGEPIKEGEIRVLPLDGRGTVGAAPIVDGEFTLMSEAGKKRIEIREPKLANPNQAMAKAAPGGMTIPPLRVERLPRKYNRDSEIEKDVMTDGENHFVFDLKE